MTRKQHLAIVATVIGLAIAIQTDVQGILGIVSGFAACGAFTWFLLDITK